MSLGKVPFIPQMESVECGAACLGMVLAWHGHHAPLPELRQACGVSRDGVNALAMLRAARTYGLEAEAYRMEVEDLRLLPLPAILHWDFCHFVVLEKISRKGKAWIVDPEGGRRTLGPRAFAKSFTGVVLGFEPGEGFCKRAARKPTLRRYRKLFRENLPALGLLLGASILLQLAGLVIPVSQQLLVDRVIVPRQPSWLWGVAAALGCTMVFQAMLTLGRTYVLDTLQALLNLKLLRGFMNHLLRLPIGFFLLRQPGDLLQRLGSHDTIRSLLSTQVVTSILDSLLVLGYGGLMFAYSPPLALAVLGVVCFRLVFQVVVRTITRQIVATELAASGATHSALLESLGSVECIKGVAAGEAMVQRWTDCMIQQTNAGLRRKRLEILSGIVTTVVGTLSQTAIFAMAGREVMAGRMTVGVFSAFLTLRGLFTAPFMSLVGALGSWQHLRSHLARLDDVMETPEEPTGTVLAGRLKGEIRLEGVSFAYTPGAPPSVKNLNLTIAPGEKIALVGPTGAGKTTLARLLLGMLIPSEGRILFDGVDLREYDLVSLRSRMGVVLQETFLFNDTVRANLTLSHPEATLADLRMACEAARVLDVIEALPLGFDTPLGENAQTLSGGQRQRLSLARALIHHPSILLLDEATSSLDLATEAEVHARLAAFGCTRVLIAHRLATVRDADRILVLQDGELVAQGPYGDLMREDGLFQSLARAAEVTVA